MATIEICFASDNNFVKPLATAIASILTTNKSNTTNIYILDDGISDENKEKLAQLQGIKPHKLEYLHLDVNMFDAYPTLPQIPRAAYFRYMIPQLLPKLDRVLYLDCDIIVCGDLAELWNIDLAGYYIAGVHDLIYTRHRARLKLKCDTYINSGVLLMDTALCRKDNLHNSLLKATDTYKNIIKWPDQDIINIVCNDKIKIIDDKWNYQYSNFMRSIDTDKPEYYKNPMHDFIILHFSTLNKPWKRVTKAKNIPLFWKYFMMTPWRDEYTLDIKFRQFITQARLAVKWAPINAFRFINKKFFL